MEDAEAGTTLVFGLPVEDMDDNVQALECLVLVKGINMENGSPIMVTVGSGGMPIWEIIGMLEMEAHRLKTLTTFMMHQLSNEEEDDSPGE